MNLKYNTNNLNTADILLSLLIFIIVSSNQKRRKYDEN